MLEHSIQIANLAELLMPRKTKYDTDLLLGPFNVQQHPNFFPITPEIDQNDGGQLAYNILFWLHGVEKS